MDGSVVGLLILGLTFIVLACLPATRRNAAVRVSAQTGIAIGNSRKVARYFAWPLFGTGIGVGLGIGLPDALRPPFPRYVDHEFWYEWFGGSGSATATVMVSLVAMALVSAAGFALRYRWTPDATRPIIRPLVRFAIVFAGVLSIAPAAWAVQWVRELQETSRIRDTVPALVSMSALFLVVGCLAVVALAIAIPIVSHSTLRRPDDELPAWAQFEKVTLLTTLATLVVAASFSTISAATDLARTMLIPEGIYGSLFGSTNQLADFLESISNGWGFWGPACIGFVAVQIVIYAKIAFPLEYAQAKARGVLARADRALQRRNARAGIPAPAAPIPGRAPGLTIVGPPKGDR